MVNIQAENIYLSSIMIKYFIGTLFGALFGFAIAFLLIKSRKKESEKGVETNVGSYFRQIGEWDTKKWDTVALPTAYVT